MKKTSPPRRSLLAAGVGVAAAALTPRIPLAQDMKFPSAPVRIVLPFGPGSVNDTVLRMLAERLTQRWGQPVIVENKPGASSMIGTAQVANAKPDGHTLLVNVTLMVQNPALRSKLPYDPKMLVPLMQLNRQQLPIYVRPDIDVGSVSGLVAHAKANPGKVNFATWGIGSTAHIIMSRIETEKGISMVHVPYKGTADIMRALIAGESDVAVSDLLSPDAYFRNGKLKVIAVTGPKRVAHLPNVPTLAETGVTGFEGYNWLGLFAPEGTPPAVMRFIHEEIVAVQSDPRLQERFQKEFYVEPATAGPEEFAKIYARDAATWASVIKGTKIVLD